MCGLGGGWVVGWCLRSLAGPRDDRGFRVSTVGGCGVLAIRGHPPLILREPPASADLRQHERPQPLQYELCEGSSFRERIWA